MKNIKIWPRQVGKAMAIISSTVQKAVKAFRDHEEQLMRDKIGLKVQLLSHDASTENAKEVFHLLGKSGIKLRKARK